MERRYSQLDGDVTSDGWSVNTTQPPYQPSRAAPAKGGDPRLADPSKHPLPPQSAKTIGDTLSAKGISWAWYAGAWNLALQDGMQDPAAPRKMINTRADGAPYFVTHHQPFNYFARFAPGTADRSAHLKDYTELAASIDRGELPQVALLQAARHPQRAPRLRRRPFGGHSHRRADRQDQGEPAVVIDRDHRHLRRKRRFLGSRRSRLPAIAGDRARASRRSSSRLTPSGITSTTRSTTRRRSSNSSPVALRSSRCRASARKWAISPRHSTSHSSPGEALLRRVRCLATSRRSLYEIGYSMLISCLQRFPTVNCEVST